MTSRKTITWTIQTFVSKVIPLFFKMFSRLFIAFFPRSKCLLISWLQSPSAVILEPKKIKPVTVSICLEVMGPDAMILVFWMLSFKPTFSLSSFIMRLFSSSSLSAIRVVSSAYLRLLIFLPAVLYQRPWIWCPRDPKLQEACMLLITEFVLLRAGWYFQCYIPRTGRWQRGGGCIWGTGDNCASVSIYSMWSLWRWGMKLRVSREGKRLCPGPGMWTKWPVLGAKLSPLCWNRTLRSPGAVHRP